MAVTMTLEELNKLTPAYGSFSTIECCDIPDYYKEIFPHKCRCGAEMIMTEPGHTQLQCCNNDCWVKMGYRLAYFISSFGYKGFGEQSALTLVEQTKDKFKYDSFLSVFLLSDSDIYSCLPEHYAEVFIDIREDLKMQITLFQPAIAALGIPGIGIRSNLFNVVKSPVTILQYALNNRLEELCDACNIRAPITRFKFVSARADIIVLMTEVMTHLKGAPKGEIYVAITGKVHLRLKEYTRYEFLDKCEAICDKDGNQLFQLIETKSTAKLQYVIADEATSSEKYRLGKRLGILITADEFYDVLLQRAGLENEIMEEDKQKDSLESKLKGEG